MRIPATLLLATICVASLLQGCAYPRVVKYYDEECQIMAKKMVLDVAKVIVLDSCQNETCLAGVLTGVVTLTTSSIVSGSIVHVGNTVYWRERNKNCKRGEPYVPDKAQSPSQAASSAT